MAQVRYPDALGITGTRVMTAIPARPTHVRSRSTQGLEFDGAQTSSTHLCLVAAWTEMPL